MFKKLIIATIASLSLSGCANNFAEDTKYISHFTDAEVKKYCPDYNKFRESTYNFCQFALESNLEIINNARKEKRDEAKRKKDEIKKQNEIRRKIEEDQRKLKISNIEKSTNKRFGSGLSHSVNEARGGGNINQDQFYELDFPLYISYCMRGVCAGRMEGLRGLRFRVIGAKNLLAGTHVYGGFYKAHISNGEIVIIKIED